MQRQRRDDQVEALIRKRQVFEIEMRVSIGGIGLDAIADPRGEVRPERQLVRK